MMRAFSSTSRSCAAAIVMLMLVAPTLHAERSRATVAYTGYDAVTRTVEFTTDRGTQLERLEKLDAFAVFRSMRKQFDQTDGEGQLDIANLARDAGFFEHARRHYRAARRADSSLDSMIAAETVKLDREAATHYMRLAEKALQKRNPAEARRLFNKVVKDHSRDRLASEAAQALALMDARKDARLADWGNRRDARRETEYLRDAEKHGQGLFENNRRGLQEGSGNRAIRWWKAAIRDGERALESLDKLKRWHEKKQSSTTVARRIELVTGELVRTRLNLASQYSIRQSYNKAFEEVNRALALDPDNEQALAARARIEDNVGDGGILVW